MSEPLLEANGITKSFGIVATILGAIVGGVVVARYGLLKALLIGGVLQAVTNLLFAWQAAAGHDIVVLAVAISADNFTGSLGSIAFVAYLSSLCTTGMAGTQAGSRSGPTTAIPRGPAVQKIVRPVVRARCTIFSESCPASFSGSRPHAWRHSRSLGLSITFRNSPIRSRLSANTNLPGSRAPYSSR